MRLCAEDPGRLNDRLAQWLFTVCRNRALDVKRKESRMSPLAEFELEAYASPELSPALAAERSDATDQVLRLVAGLPANQQEVVRLKFQNGLTYQEISGITNLSVTHVGFLIHTAVKTIRRRVEQEAKISTSLLAATV